MLLPYDEAFVGLSRSSLVAVNSHLLAFMAHDRVTLAGTMISIGVFYSQLALYGIRRGAAWARRAITISGSVGFVSFFLFLGFHYFDPLHALVALVLVPFFLVGVRGTLPDRAPTVQPNLYNDLRWFSAQWGQLLFVALGVGLTVAGSVIAIIGISGVFVHEDLEFLRTTAAALHTVSPRLLPLVAHDRAGLGGALASDGLILLLTALWGYQQGARWVWWTFIGAGVPGFVAALGVHLAVGYTNLWHVGPAIAAALIYILGLALSYPYLHYPASQAASLASRATTYGTA